MGRDRNSLEAALSVPERSRSESSSASRAPPTVIGCSLDEGCGQRVLLQSQPLRAQCSVPTPGPSKDIRERRGGTEAMGPTRILGR